MAEKICEPSINWRHPDGPTITCSTGTLYWPTLTETIQLKSGRLTVEQLDVRHRNDAFLTPRVVRY